MKEYNEIFIKNSRLEGSRIILRSFTPEDKEDIYEYASADIVTRYLTWPSIKTLEETEKIIANFYLGRPGIFAIELKSENKCIGCIDIRVNEADNKASFGYVLTRAYWNNGYMTEALELILNLAFTKLEVNRVEATHYVGNSGSGEVMKKCGMKYEGTGIQEVIVKGEYFDVVHYGIIKRDYK
ncbi:GNAT family protein [Clostridium sp.]|uniref:GNAT family N-acetyltransferase n=1 Tax=Clostridium sp. TaxID=1506 RepID=UPI0032173732